MIYFARVIPNGPIKIGFSISVETRIRTISTTSPFPIELIGDMEGTLEDETRLHSMFADYRLNGEWFEPNGKLLDFIEANTTKDTIETVENNTEEHTKIEDLTTIAVRDVPSKTWARLKAQAALDGVSIGDALAKAIEYYLKDRSK
jgi:hypothetical protein